MKYPQSIIPQESYEELEEQLENITNQFSELQNRNKKLYEETESLKKLNNELIVSKTKCACKYYIECDLKNAQCLEDTKLQKICKIKFKKDKEVDELFQW